MEPEHYIGKTDEEVEKMIQELPKHLEQMFDIRIKAGYKRRHALFIVSSYSWANPGQLEKRRE